MNIYHLISNKEWGEREQYTLLLAERQRNAGNYVEIVCRNIPSIIAPFKAKEFPLSTLPLKGITDMDSAVRLARMVKRRKNCIVHVHNFKNAFTANMARMLSENKGLKIVMTRSLIKRGSAGMVHRQLYKEIDKMIFTSELAKNVFLSGHPKVNINKLCVIHNSTVINDIHPIHLREVFNIPDSKAIIMYYGPLERCKGVDVLIKAASQLDKDSYHLFIAGSGKRKYSKHLQNIVVSNSMEGNVTFITQPENILNYIASCDIGVLPYIAPESHGGAIMEYLGRGKALITTDNGMQCEILTNNKDAILVAPGSPYELANAMDVLIKNPEKRMEIGENAKLQFEKNLSYDIFFDKTTEVYNSLI